MCMCIYIYIYTHVSSSAQRAKEERPIGRAAGRVGNRAAAVGRGGVCFRCDIMLLAVLICALGVTGAASGGEPQTLYETLGVDPAATPAQIRSAYRKLALGTYALALLFHRHLPLLSLDPLLGSMF